MILPVSGRYTLFSGGAECGEERWELAGSADGYVVTGVQELEAPHPFPNRQEYRVTLSRSWRPTGIEIRWYVRDRLLTAFHRADGAMWRVQIDYSGQRKEQEGDYPEFCEVEYGTHLLNTVILARRDFQVGGEHEFPVLRIGPPYMAVSPERMLYRCVEQGEHRGPSGAVSAKRYVVTVPPQTESEGYSFWADEDGFVLESYEGSDSGTPWMRLVELAHPSGASLRSG